MPIDIDKPGEILLFDFLTERIAAAVEGEPLWVGEDGFDLHDTIYQSITAKRGIRISDAVGDMRPGPGGVIQESNVDIQLVGFVKVEGKNKKERQDALTAIWVLEKEIYRLLFEYSTLDGRVCDVLPETGARGYDVFDGNPYAVAIIPLVINRRD